VLDGGDVLSRSSVTTRMPSGSSSRTVVSPRTR
jgi:hypothetical protein